MNKFLFLAFLLAGACSCKLQPNSDRLAGEYAGARTFQLRLNPPAGSNYSYDITSRSEYKFEAGDKKIDNRSKVDASVVYLIDKDSTGNFVFRIRYDKVHIYSKNGDAESDLDAANASNSVDPVEQLLGSLRDANIVATLGPTGEVKSVSGFREMYDRFMAQFRTANAYQIATVKQRWESTVGNELIHKNMDQLFRIFPDSAVHIGDKWHLNSKQKSEFGLNTAMSFTLTDIRDQTAFIESEGTITSDSVSKYMGNDVATDLKGEQKGEFQVETRTGMLVSARVTATVKGTLQVMDREIPLTIETSLKMDRR